MTLKKAKLWFDEHFPIHHIFAGASLYLVVRFTVQMTFSQGHLNWGVLDLFGILIPTKHFFLRQVLAQHKEHEIIKIHKPGLVSVIVQVASFFLMSPSVLSTFLFISLWAWTYFEFKDFFIGDFLKRHLIVQRLMHFLVVPFLCVLLFILLQEHIIFISSYGIVFPVVLASF